MNTGEKTESLDRPRLLLTAYHFDREYSMESRLAWQRAQWAATQFDVTVICARTDGPPRSAEQPSLTDINDAGDVNDSGDIEVAALPLDPWERRLMRHPITYYAGYRRWHRRVFQLARRLHAERPFNLVHHVSFCGFREPGQCWRLGAPFIWGPLGGTHHFPTAYLGQLGIRGAMRELARNFVNSLQLRFGRRVRTAMRSAAETLAANRAAARDLAPALGRAPAVQLETGISTTARSARDPRDPRDPLKVLWAGRLRPWKGLPLLLRAMALLPAERRCRLRVLGEGPAKQRWKRLAARLGIAGQIEWVGWPPYRGQLPHYKWADVFAFTSLRDTSGTGLLEALAAGVPLVAVDHQGAADIVTGDCGTRVPVSTPRATIAGFRDALARLSSDGDELARLSAGAIGRAQEFDWGRQWERMQAVYERALAGDVDSSVGGSRSLSAGAEALSPTHHECELMPAGMTDEGSW